MTDDIDADDELFLDPETDANASTFVQPILFLPIGPPTFFLEESEARTKLIQFGEYCNAPGRRPISIVCISARWISSDEKFRIMSNLRPTTIHDFVGFPDSLYDIEYVAEGNSLGAARIAEALSNAGIEWEFDEKRGFDFGCWSPLALLFPDADVPVVQVSLHGSLRAENHIALGQVLGALRHDGYLLVCTGGVTHNPMEISLSADDRQPPPIWAETVDTFVASVLLSPPQSGSGGEPAACAQRARRIASGDGIERIASAMVAAHPAGTYLLPLLVATAAAGPCAALHRGWLHGSLSMAAYIFGAEAPAAAARRHLAAMGRR
jgi:4,5-DOPA dioxygenase extradiol